MYACRHLVVRLFLAAALALAAGCSGGEEATVASSSPPSDQPLTTLFFTEVDIEWSPADTMPEKDARAIVDALTSYGAQALFPSRPAPGDAAAVLGHFWLHRYYPGGRVQADVAAYTGELDLILSLTSVPLTNGGSSGGPRPEGRVLDVRGSPGWAYDNGYIRFLNWQEGDMLYHAEFDILTLEQAVAWLESWFVLP